MSKQTGAGKTGPLPRTGRRARPVDPESLAMTAGRITGLEEQKDPQRRSLLVDGRFVLGLDLETIHRCGFKVGQAVEGPALLRAYQLDQAKRAWDAALTLLAASPRTVSELGRRLSRSFAPEVADEVIDRLLAGGWLDDRAYAASYIRAKREFGGRRLLADLVRKGVAREVAAEAVQEALGEVDVTEQAREVAARRLAKLGAVDRPTAWRRLMGYLARRGFVHEVISRVLEPLLEDLPAQPERQGNRAGWRREEANGSGGSGLRRSSSLQRKRPLRSSDRFTEED
ncbi:MAG: regulatory protein RecX [Bacillota bacterium]